MLYEEKECNNYIILEKRKKFSMNSLNSKLLEATKIKKYKSCSAGLLPYLNNTTTESCNYVVQLNETEQSKVTKTFNIYMHRWPLCLC